MNYTAEEIDRMSLEELEMLAEYLTPEEKNRWADYGYDGNTYESIMTARNNRSVKFEDAEKR
jgi:hypothetical protein